MSQILIESSVSLKNAIIFISYHPGSLGDYDYFRTIDKGSSLHALIMCRHPYVTQEIIDLYSDKYDYVLILPDINYEKNIIRGFIEYFMFINKFCKWIRSILADIESFSVISDCSAYLPVNALISTLNKNNKFKKLISIREDYYVNTSVQIPTTLLTMFYTKVLNLYTVRAHKGLSYLYKNEPRDMIISLISPYERRIAPKQPLKNSAPSFYIVKPVLDRDISDKNIIVFYSDRELGEYGSSLSSEEHKNRIRRFFVRLLKFYKNYKIICKPHPLDQGSVMDGMENVEYELYQGGLSSQMHLHININNIRACYSVASTSLLYSASLGIPSYTLYKYLEYNNAYPKIFFENNNMQHPPFLYHIKNLEEIGIIDDIRVEPTTDKFKDNWHQIMYQCLIKAQN